MTDENGVNTTVVDVFNYLQNALISAEDLREELDEVKWSLEHAKEAENQRQQKVQKLTKEICEDHAELASIAKQPKIIKYECDGAKLTKEISKHNKVHLEIARKQMGIRDNMEEIEAQKKSMIYKREELAQVINLNFQNFKTLCAMYRKMTNLTWCSYEEPHLCQGYIAQEGDTVPFSVNANQDSAYIIANRIWKLMDAKKEEDIS